MFPLQALISGDVPNVGNDRAVHVQVDGQGTHLATSHVVPESEIRRCERSDVVAIALHVSNQFASPSPGLFYYDFRTASGTELDDYFEISASGLPKGMVNREGFPTQTHKKAYTSWSGLVALELQKEPEADITITNSYDSISRTVTATVKSKFLVNLQGDFFLNVMYVEDSIIQPQLFPGNVVVNDYVFNHVLRGSLNGTWGEKIAINPAEFDESTKSYSTVLVADAVAKNCRVVAYIYNNTTKAVIQAEEMHIE